VDVKDAERDWEGLDDVAVRRGMSVYPAASDKEPMRFLAYLFRAAKYGLLVFKTPISVE